MAQPKMGRDLERVFGLYKDFSLQTKGTNTAFNISQIDTNPGKGKGMGKRGGSDEDIPKHIWKKAKVEDVYYPPKEHELLSKPQKAKLKWLCRKRGPSETKKGKAGDSQIHALVTQFKSMTETMSTISKVLTKIRKETKGCF